MDGIHSLHAERPNFPFKNSDSTHRVKEDWEEWDSELDDDEGFDSHDEASSQGKAPLLSPTTSSQVHPRTKPTASPATTSSLATPISQYSTQKPARLKSRARQKAQNAKAGIRLVTDMSNYRKQQAQQQQLQQQRQQQQQQAQQAQQQQNQVTPIDSRAGRFVDAAALRALEGKPSDTSIGSFHWLKRKGGNGNNGTSPAPGSQNNTPTTAGPTGTDLSPNDGGIVIGISMPEDDMAGRTISPNTAGAASPADLAKYGPQSLAFGAPERSQPVFLGPQKSGPSPRPVQGQLQSAWSPDTEFTSPGSTHISSSIYSQQSFAAMQRNAPPVPSVPSPYLNQTKPISTSAARAPSRDNSLILDDYDIDDDLATPITLFEEDGNIDSERRASRARSHMPRSPANTYRTTRSGWWDHVQTPFQEHPASPLSAGFSANQSPTPTTPASHKSPLAARAKEAPSPIPPVPVVAMAQAPPPVSERVLSSLPSPITMATNIEEEWWAAGKDEKKSKAGIHKPALSVTVPSPRAQRLHSPPAVASSSRSVPNSSAASPPPRPVSRVIGKAESNAIQTPNNSSHPNQLASNANTTPLDAPPPYEPPSRPEMAVRYRAVFPPGHPMRANFPPSPGPISPRLANTMTSQGGIQMSEVPLTPAGVRSAAAAAGTPLPRRPNRAFVPASSLPPKGERTRQRHEKEEAISKRAGNLWRGRGCMPTNGCFGRSGRVGRKRRRICIGVFGGILGAITLIVVLAVTLTQKHVYNEEPYSFWLNTTNFPPVPTGVTSVVGTENAVSVSGCVKPQTLWSCSLPKEEQKTNQPFSGDSPSFFIQIQFDNSSQALWDVPDGTVPTPAATTAGKAAATASATQKFDAGFTPQPQPPSFEEMWFLGNTTDNIVSDHKAGEPTPFYITLLSSVNATTAGNNTLSRRDDDDDGVDVLDGISSGNESSLVPPPVVNADGTGAPAVMHPLPFQQPLRLYDRGLPTEHFGFYSYFSKSIYVRSIQAGEDGGDSDGGALESDAAYVVTWTQVRFLVQIWTRMGNSTKMVGSGSTSISTGATNSARTNTTQPGTFPYPVTISEDLHGGDFDKKGAFARVVNSEQKIDSSNASLILSNVGFGGTLINHSKNPSFGGSDGGTGGCKCSWANFVGVNGDNV